MKKERVSPSDDAVLDDLRDALRRYEGPGHVRLHPRSKRLGRRVLVTVGATAVAACLALAGTTFLGGGSKRDIAYAATPPSLHYHLTPGMPSAHDLLLQLADKAAAQPDQTGRYDYVSIRSIELDRALSEDQAMTVANGGVLPDSYHLYTRQYWVAADGSGRVEDSGTPDTSGAKPAWWLNPPTELPTDTSAMQSILKEIAPGGPREPTAQEFGYLETQQFVDPSSQAAILRVLASESNVTDAGTVTDRVGREGVAVNQLSSDGKFRFTLIFDPSTGSLLDAEQTLLDPSEPVGTLTYSPSGPDDKHPIPFRDYPIYVHTPAVTGYTVWLKTGRVDSTDQTP
jgi:hypothetical protein